MAQTSAERRANKRGLYVVFSRADPKPTDEVGPAANEDAPPTPGPAPALTGSGLVDKVFAELKIRLAEDRGFRFEPQRLAALRDDVRKAINFGGQHSADAFAEAAKLYQPLPNDYGQNLLRLFYSISSEMRRAAKYDPPAEIADPLTDMNFTP